MQAYWKLLTPSENSTRIFVTITKPSHSTRSLWKVSKLELFFLSLKITTQSYDYKAKYRDVFLKQSEAVLYA